MALEQAVDAVARGAWGEGEFVGDAHDFLERVMRSPGFDPGTRIKAAENLLRFARPTKGAEKPPAPPEENEFSGLTRADVQREIARELDRLPDEERERLLNGADSSSPPAPAGGKPGERR